MSETIEKHILIDIIHSVTVCQGCLWGHSIIIVLKIINVTTSSYNFCLGQKILKEKYAFTISDHVNIYII